MAKTFNQLVEDYKTLTGDSSTANETLGKTLLNDFIREILMIGDLTSNRGYATDQTVASQQYYPIPYNCRKIRKIKVTISNTTYPLIEVKTEEEWNKLNMISYESDYPAVFYVRSSTNEYGIFPIPSTSGNIITISFQEKIKTLGASDYTTGTVSATNGSSTITGSGTSWTSSMVGRYIKIVDFWYKIASVTDATHLTIYGEYNEGDVTGSSYTISELVPLPEGAENLPLYKALALHFQKRDNASARQQAVQYMALYTDGISNLLRADSKTEGQVFEQTLVSPINPNNYPEITT